MTGPISSTLASGRAAALWGPSGRRQTSELSKFTCAYQRLCLSSILVMKGIRGLS